MTVYRSNQSTRFHTMTCFNDDQSATASLGHVIVKRHCMKRRFNSTTTEAEIVQTYLEKDMKKIIYWLKTRSIAQIV